MADNMRIYSALATTPQEAQRKIGAGKLAGYTDINPMWRIKALTQLFGPQGQGWRLEVVSWDVVEAAGEKMAHVWLNLSYKEGDAWSAAVPGFGGSKLSGKGVGDGLNDEAFKMAFTDALSVCCKGLGLASDIYYDKDQDRTKYSLASVSKTAPVTVTYKPCDADMYEHFVAAAARGQLTPKGRTAEESWKDLTNAGAKELTKFRQDVYDYKVNNSLR